jgi:hypothetical protein
MTASKDIRQLIWEEVQNGKNKRQTRVRIKNQLRSKSKLDSIVNFWHDRFKLHKTTLFDGDVITESIQTLPNGKEVRTFLIVNLFARLSEKSDRLHSVQFR